jgi:glycosyltransferase involved in cell wall biosynthesis
VASIGLSGLLLEAPRSGTAVYTRNLVPWLPRVAPDLLYRLYTRYADFHAQDIKLERHRTPFGPLNHGHGVGARLDKVAWETLVYPLHAAMRGIELLHSLYFAAPLIASGRIVVTVHDVIPLVLPHYHRGRQSDVYSRFMAATVRRADRIITVSEHSRSDIVRVLRVPEDRVCVTYEAVDERFLPDRIRQEEKSELGERYGLPERFFLYLGGAERRKNILLLLKAWHIAKARLRDLEVHLVIVADFPPPDALYPDIPGMVRSFGLAEDIVLVAQVEEEDKPSLYRAALGFCFPSLYEGFGFTPLEALACGAPVICSDATSLPEIVGGAAWLLPPDDAGLWAEAIIRLADSPAERATLSQRGPERARQFSWRRTAEETAAVYRKVLSA